MFTSGSLWMWPALLMRTLKRAPAAFGRCQGGVDGAGVGGVADQGRDASGRQSVAERGITFKDPDLRRRLEVAAM